VSDLKSGGYHWQTTEHVARWVQIQRDMEPQREIGFQALLEQFPDDRSAQLSILDLGSGDGKVASVILDRFPAASAVLVDFSAPMMEKGAERLARFHGRYRYEAWDMNSGQWPATLRGPFDAVVSSAAIHHLNNARKEWLALEVMARLAFGGRFANYDLFRNPDAKFAEDDIHGRTCATIDEATNFLINASFVDIVVAARLPRPRHQGELALLLGIKPSNDVHNSSRTGSFPRQGVGPGDLASP
jgi:trans-aconitate methyltransferase